MRSLVQESNMVSGNDRNLSSLNNENMYYNNSKSVTGLGLREINMNEQLAMPIKSEKPEKYLGTIPEKETGKKTRKGGFCHCGRDNKKSKKGCEIF